MPSDLIIYALFIFLLGLCWGSFLNGISYRLAHDMPLFGRKRSFCPYCKKNIAWYDLIPLFSFFILRGKCRLCKKPISWLYPCIEFFTGLTFLGLYYRLLFFDNSLISFYMYLFLATLLIISTRTDLDEMVVFRIATLWMVPVGFVASYSGWLPISFIESVSGALIGYGILWIVSSVFTVILKKKAMGEGDFEVLALIGAFMGPVGAWFSLLIGSIMGLVLSGVYLAASKQGRGTHIPFVPFLATGALSYLIFEPFIMRIFLGF